MLDYRCNQSNYSGTRFIRHRQGPAKKCWLTRVVRLTVVKCFMEIQKGPRKLCRLTRVSDQPWSDKPCCTVPLFVHFKHVIIPYPLCFCLQLEKLEKYGGIVGGFIAVKKSTGDIFPRSCSNEAVKNFINGEKLARQIFSMVLPLASFSPAEDAQEVQSKGKLLNLLTNWLHYIIPAVLLSSHEKHQIRRIDDTLNQTLNY